MDMKRFHKSADGSLRCRLCQLHPDTCTCEPNHPIHAVLEACGFGYLRVSNPHMLSEAFDSYERQRRGEG